MVWLCGLGKEFDRGQARGGSFSLRTISEEEDLWKEVVGADIESGSRRGAMA